MIILQPGLLSARGAVSGPWKWIAKGGTELTNEDREAIDSSVAARPMGLAAWPDGRGAKWLVDGALICPEAKFWWCMGKRLISADMKKARVNADAFELFDEVGEWLEIKWGQLPGSGMPDRLSWPLKPLLCRLSNISAGALVQSLRGAPVDLCRSSDRDKSDDMLLSVKPPSRIMEIEAEAIAREGGHPSPELAGWVLEQARRNRNSFFQPDISQSVKRLSGILLKWHWIFHIVGWPTEDPSPLPEVSKEGAAVLEEAARKFLGSSPDSKDARPKPAELAKRVAQAEAVDL